VKKLVLSSHVLLLSLLLLTNCATFMGGKNLVGQHPQRLEIKSSLDYLLYLPNEYNDDSKEWPLMLFLHGAGERGSNLQKVKTHGPPKLVKEIPNMPFIIVSPQCPEEQWWTGKISELDALLKYITTNYCVDTRRIYVTGLSMGGYGTWALAKTYPNRFAAIAPICGDVEMLWICEIKDIPTWVFHGAKDETVPIERSQELVGALKECGGNPKFTVYPEAGHDSWTETYNNPDLYKWFLEQSLE
jgi:predicted peptidase